MKTIITLTIDHNKPLPADATDQIANRVYTWLHAAGIRCDVAASIEAAGLVRGPCEAAGVEDLCLAPRERASYIRPDVCAFPGVPCCQDAKP